MVRTPGERVAPALSRAGWLALPWLALAGGCSFVLDFDKPVDAPPPDAAVTEAQCMAQEPNDTPATAKPLAPGEVQAAICGNEVDYYKLTVAANQRLSVKATFQNRGGAGDIDLRLLTGDGAMAIDDSKTTADMEEVMCPGGTRCPVAPLAAGDYVVEVLGSTPSVESPYTLTYTQTPM